MRMAAIVMAAMMSVSLLSCGGNDDDDDNVPANIPGSNTSNELLGWWASTEEFAYGNAFHFINSNTVVYYVIQPSLSSKCPDKFPYRSGWYMSSGETYTYVFADGKVIISNGRIMTLVNGRLVDEGSSYEDGLRKL